MLSNDRAPLSFIVICLLLSIFVILIVLAGVFNTALADYFLLLKDTGFLKAIIFTFQTSIPATLLSFFMGIPAGFYLARYKNTLTKIIDVIFDIPIVIPPLIVGILFLTFFNMPFIKSFYSFIFNVYGAIIAQFFIACPFTVKAAKSSFELVPSIYEKISMTLGANFFRAFYDTTFKLAFPGILSGLILTFLRSFGEFGATLIVGGGIPGKTENIPVNIYLNISTGNFEKAMAASILTIIFICTGIFFVKLTFREKNIEQ